MMKNKSESRFCGIIPARYASTRFPGKPLVLIGGIPMIRRVYEQSLKSLDEVYVATDDERIREVVLKFGGKVIMTSAQHQSGTDRCAEAAAKILTPEAVEINVFLNIQGDEPFISPDQINTLKSCFDEKSVEIATLVRKTRPGEDIFNTNHPKVIIDVASNAIYFSRSVIPFHRDCDLTQWAEKHIFYKHVGLYAYTAEALKKITLLPRSPLEIAESLEQNRWIENGFKIRTAITEMESIGIDTPDDVKRAESALRHNY